VSCAIARSQWWNSLSNCLLYSTVSRSVFTCAHFISTIRLSFHYLMSKSWNELLRHWRSSFHYNSSAFAFKKQTSLVCPWIDKLVYGCSQWEDAFWRRRCCRYTEILSSWARIRKPLKSRFVGLPPPQSACIMWLLWLGHERRHLPSDRPRGENNMPANRPSSLACCARYQPQNLKGMGTHQAQLEVADAGWRGRVP